MSITALSQIADLPLTHTWLVEQALRCVRCGDVGAARFSVRTFFAFDAQIHEGTLRCGCGGRLAYSWSAGLIRPGD